MQDTECAGRYEAVVLVRSELSVVEAGDTVMIVQHPDGSEKSLSSGPIHKVLRRLVKRQHIPKTQEAAHILLGIPKTQEAAHT